LPLSVIPSLRCLGGDSMNPKRPSLIHLLISIICLIIVTILVLLSSMPTIGPILFSIAVVVLIPGTCFGYHFLATRMRYSNYCKSLWKTFPTSDELIEDLPCQGPPSLRKKDPWFHSIDSSFSFFIWSNQADWLSKIRRLTYSIGYPGIGLVGGKFSLRVYWFTLIHSFNRYRHTHIISVTNELVNLKAQVRLLLCLLLRTIKSN